jgi:Flp pilus assembly protein TadG
MRALRTILRDPRGSSAAEFAIILPLALLLLFGIIDLGRYAWTFNQLEKAVQTGARFAVATEIVPQGLNRYDFTNSCPGGPLRMGARICPEALGTISCSSAGGGVSCTCTSGACNSAMIGTVNAQAFTRIVDTMRNLTPEVTAQNVTVRYSGSGVGFLGDPATDAAGNALSDIAPVVTVEVAGSQMRVLTLLGYGLVLPTIKASLTLEDGDGTTAF